MIVQICIGSSCHIKGSYDIVKLMEEAIAENKLENEITLAGSFCTGKCNRIGVTVTIDDNIFTGVAPEKFDEFFKKNVLDVFEKEGK